ncbi:hypothetical protein ACM25N_11020 [Roseovarius sp. C7]|uniref:hypothetical protein n=1 Tax=Roseovarius sp. C7 TaxID=3398643 RepID=UPI0039F65444
MKVAVAWIVGTAIGFMIGLTFIAVILVLVGPLVLLFWWATDGEFTISAFKVRIQTILTSSTKTSPEAQADALVKILPEYETKDMQLSLAPYEKVGARLPTQNIKGIDWGGITGRGSMKVSRDTRLENYPVTAPSFSAIISKNGETRLVGVLFAFDPVRKMYAAEKVRGVFFMINENGVIRVMTEYHDHQTEKQMMNMVRLVTTSPAQAMKYASTKLRKPLRKAKKPAERGPVTSYELKF